MISRDNRPSQKSLHPEFDSFYLPKTVYCKNEKCKTPIRSTVGKSSGYCIVCVSNMPDLEVEIKYEHKVKIKEKNCYKEPKNNIKNWTVEKIISIRNEILEEEEYGTKSRFSGVSSMSLSSSIRRSLLRAKGRNDEKFIKAAEALLELITKRNKNRKDELNKINEAQIKSRKKK